MKRLTQQYGRLLTLIACRVVVGGYAFGDSTDVFPLIEGLQQVYKYQSLVYTWSFSVNVSTYDSGAAEYTIADSASVNDTTIAWTVVERVNTIRHVVSNFPAMDTTYSVSISHSFTLEEQTTGHHELRGSSRVWEFPSSFLNGQIYPVFRFSDSTSTFMLHDFPGCHIVVLAGNYDSLLFTGDSGLVSRAYSRCFDRDEEGWVSWRTAKLLSRRIVSVQEPDQFSQTPKLFPNYPNPFNPSTVIRFQLPVSSWTTLRVYDVLGREVATLVNEMMDAGTHAVTFTANSGHSSGSPQALASGIYIARMETVGFVQTRKLLLLK